MLVYQGLSESYRYASDRHHTFILEAARELQARYTELGVTYLLHVERAAYRAPRLAQLSTTAAVIVTDDFPVEATRKWTDQLTGWSRGRGRRRYSLHRAHEIDWQVIRSSVCLSRCHCRLVPPATGSNLAEVFGARTSKG